jgi:hydroxymethylbilane synthase
VRKLVIGTRGSALALWQARHVAARLEAIHGGEVSLEIIKTAGDRLAGKHPGQFSAKGIFVKELEDALLAGSVDLAVHSVKDLPGELPPGLTMGAYPGREDPRDALITPDGAGLEGVPRGARIGTTSLRRRAQLLRHRPDLSFTDMRGNVDTRMRKVQQGEVDGLILALAGITRLGLRGDTVHPLPTEVCLPAPGQGALGIEARAEDEEVMTLLGRLDHEDTRYEVTAERAVLSALDAGCLVPLAALARRDGDRLSVESVVASPDGRRLLKETVVGSPSEAGYLGLEVAKGLRGQGAEELLQEARRSAEPPPPGDG